MNLLVRRGLVQKINFSGETKKVFCMETSTNMKLINCSPFYQTKVLSSRNRSRELTFCSDVDYRDEFVRISTMQLKMGGQAAIHKFIQYTIITHILVPSKS